MSFDVSSVTFAVWADLFPFLFVFCMGRAYVFFWVLSGKCNVFRLFMCSRRFLVFGYLYDVLLSQAKKAVAAKKAESSDDSSDDDSDDSSDEEEKPKAKAAAKADSDDSSSEEDSDDDEVRPRNKTCKRDET